MKDAISEFFSRIWNSPTLMTWGNFLTRSLSLVVLLPLIVSKFDASDVVVWYLFLSLITFQMLIDLGFTPTFTRIVAYGMGGLNANELSNIKIHTQESYNNFAPNWDTIIQVGAIMKLIYKRLSVLVFILALSLGSLAVWKPISQSTAPDSAWMAWLIVISSTSIILYGNYYLAYLQGINEIAKIQRWQMGFALMSVVTSSITLLIGGNLLALTLVRQSWMIANVIFNRWLKNTVHHGQGKKISLIKKQSAQIWDVIWPAAWRSGIGVLISAGLIQLSGVIYAQLAETDKVASYLLGLQIIRAVVSFSAAPFYSKIPVFSKLYAQHSWEQLIASAARGMSLSYWVFVVGFVSFGITADWLLELVGSNVNFPSSLVWCLLGLAFFLERYGAMHLQLYSTSNHIIWHITNGIAGIIMIILSVILFPLLDVIAFPLSILGGYLGFYSWYAALHSYKKFKLSFWSFEKNVMLPPFSVSLLYSGIHIYIYYL
ncbi:hypothetical protein TI05_03880 [Achromatium sp. WMS3]|nr:hypothetical protein TI05_03880 [Achromatium sp. WMS3]